MDETKFENKLACFYSKVNKRISDYMLYIETKIKEMREAMTRVDSAATLAETNAKHAEVAAEAAEAAANGDSLTVNSGAYVKLYTSNADSSIDIPKIRASNDLTAGFRKSGSTRGTCSGVVGTNCEATANNTFAQGLNSKATGAHSSAMGKGLIASYDSQHVVGAYNAIREDAIFIVGNGTSDTNRSNALWVTTDGRLHLNANSEIVYGG